MPGSSKHFWEYEEFDPKSRWFFVNPSEYAESLGLYIIELGHFFQGGRCYTNRVPENSFSITFTGMHFNPEGVHFNYLFPDSSYEPTPCLFSKGVTVIDNRPGYITETQGKFECYFIQFGGFMAEKYCQMLLGSEKFRRYPISWLSTLIEAFEQLVLLYRQPANERSDLYASMLMTQILCQLVLETGSEQPLYTENTYVKRTFEIIENRFSEALKLKDIANELHINSSYLSRLITNETGISFSSCLAHVRINHAKELLQTTSLSMEDIGEKCGFCNASHFVKLFHLSEGITPLQYRLQRRNVLPRGKNLT